MTPDHIHAAVHAAAAVFAVTLLLLLIQTARAAYWKGMQVEKEDGWQLLNDENEWLRERLEEANDAMRDVAWKNNVPKEQP
jgi:hypothetical protein